MPRHRWDPICPDPGPLVRPVRVDPTGEKGPTKRQAARGHFWRRTSHGFYVPADTRIDLPEQRIMEQSVRLPTGGAVSGWAGCRLHRATFFDGFEPDGETPIPVLLSLGRGGNIRGDGAVRLVREPLAADDRVIRYGIPTVSAVRAAFDAMRGHDDPREAVVDLDMMAAAAQVSICRMATYAAEHPGATGIGQVRWALTMASEHSRSPNETRLRMVWEVDAGLPRPHVNCPVHDLDGRLLGIADLLDEEAGLAVEFDGAEHRGAQRQAKDAAKEERFRRCGLEMTHVTGIDLRQPDAVVRRLLDSRSRAGFLPPSQRRWVARPPVDDLERRLAERDALRSLREEFDRQPLPDIRELRGW